jgi:hypothetical protein
MDIYQNARISSGEPLKNDQNSATVTVWSQDQSLWAADVWPQY